MLTASKDYYDDIKLFVITPAANIATNADILL